MIKFDILMLDIKSTKFNTNSFTTYKIFKLNKMLRPNTILNVSTCCICGNYIESSKSMEEKIYCKCTDIYNNKCKYIHREKFKKVLDQLIFTMYDDNNLVSNNSSTFICRLEPSRYSHEGECYPESRTCYSCWRYWCSCCGGGLGGMYGNCVYKRCRIGRKNCNLEH